MVGLIFNDFKEFMMTRNDIKEYYNRLPYKIKRAYKKYIYSLPYKESILDAIWCYLNEPEPIWFYEFKLLYLYDKYENKENNGRS